MQASSLGQEDPLEDVCWRHGSPLQYSYLRISWTGEPAGIQAIGITQSWTQLKRLSTYTHTHTHTHTHCINERVIDIERFYSICKL